MRMRTLPDNSRMRHSPEESLIEYPCDFPIKVMGVKTEDFASTIIQVTCAFDPSFNSSRLEVRDSKAGNYQSLTLTIRATSREQLDELYRTLSGHPMVKIVL